MNENASSVSGPCAGRGRRTLARPGMLLSCGCLLTVSSIILRFCHACLFATVCPPPLVPLLCSHHGAHNVSSGECSVCPWRSGGWAGPLTEPHTHSAHCRRVCGRCCCSSSSSWCSVVKQHRDHTHKRLQWPPLLLEGCPGVVVGCRRRLHMLPVVSEQQLL